MHMRRVCNFAARRRSRSAPPRHPPEDVYCRGGSPGLRVVVLSPSSQDHIFPVTCMDSNSPPTAAGQRRLYSRTSRVRSPTGFPLSFARMRFAEDHDRSEYERLDWRVKTRHFWSSQLVVAIRGGKLIQAPWLCQAIAEHHYVSSTMRLLKSSLGVASTICILPKGRKSLNIPSTEGLDANTSPSCEVVWRSKSLETSTR